MLKSSLAFFSAVLLVAGTSAAQDFDAVEIQRTDLGGGVAMLAGAGGNIGLSSGPAGVVLIDDQFAPLTEKIRVAVAEVSDEPIRFVINTHWHSDHTGGNEKLASAGAVVLAHDNVRRRMSVEQVMEAFGRTVPAAPVGALPVVTFPDSVRLHLNGDELHVFHVGAAHTDGDAMVHFVKANVIHTGDVFVKGMYPFVDRSSGGAIDGIIAGVERVLALADEETRIIPGHGAVAKREDVVRFLEVVKDVRGRIAAQIAEGMSLGEVLAAKPTAAWDAEWGQGFIDPERFTRFVYQSLE